MYISICIYNIHTYIHICMYVCICECIYILYIHMFMIQKHGDLPLPRRIARLYPFLRGKQHLMCATVKAGAFSTHTTG